ncbi:MAG: PH domain-containing protein [Candidatus Gastranaerophilales bacterium]|nr:PH domain-containing protein [Candidatus Gastranaerophilales bacterium]
MPTIDEIRNQIKKLDPTDQLIGRWEINELPNILWKDEILEDLSPGAYNNGIGLVIATNKRLVFINKGIFSLQVEDFPYNKITSVQYNLGLILGTVNIFCAGNSAEIKNIWKNQAKNFCDIARKQMEGIANKEIPSQKDNDDTISKLERLALLKEQGILTEEEFISQKQKILSMT